MNFLSAIKHAAIGYGIRRKSWDDRCILHLNNMGELEWVGHYHKDREGKEANLFSSDYGIVKEDITANDWETV